MHPRFELVGFHALAGDLKMSVVFTDREYSLPLPMVKHFSNSPSRPPLLWNLTRSPGKEYHTYPLTLAIYF